MKTRVLLTGTIATLLGGAAFAGVTSSATVPTLGEVGVVTLALGLVGAGVAALRRGRRRSGG
jgi:hypothetical protein